MSSLLRVPSDLLREVHQDLSRPHAFAAERVGFLFCRTALAGPGLRLSLATSYIPVQEDEYLEDDSVGAMIGSDAIRAAMQRGLDTGDGVFHVHRHEHLGSPWFSGVDIECLVRLAPSFHAVSPGNVHGGLVLSRDSASTLTWTDGAGRAEPGWVTFVGVPMRVRMGRHDRRAA